VVFVVVFVKLVIVTEGRIANDRSSPDVENGELRYVEVADAVDRFPRTVTTPSHLHVVNRISVCGT